MSKSTMHFGTMIALALLGACDDPERAPAETEVFLWLTSHKDTYVKCTTTDCADADLNYATLGELHVSSGEIELQHAFVQFLLPDLPQGTQVLEAYMELYHPGERENGQPDEQCLQVARVPQEWDPVTVTWNEQPVTLPVSREFQLEVRSQAWSVSSDIAPIVQQMLSDPHADNGFVVYPAPDTNLDTAFYDNTHRELDNLGKAPRLLVRALLPAEADMGEYGLPEEIPDDHDLVLDGLARMMDAAEGSDWPEAWSVGVSVNDFTCAP